MKIFFCSFSILLIYGCGLPNYISIESPVQVSTTVANAVAFKTPAIDNNIQGYNIYYKIYANHTEFESGIGTADQNAFAPESYSNNELPSEDAVLKQRGFLRIGMINQTATQFENTSFTVGHNLLGANVTTIIDFSKNPPAVYLETAATNAPVAELARGVINRKDNAADDTLLNFYNDWEFVENNVSAYTDLDLRRNKNTSGLLAYQPGVGDEYDSFVKNSTPLTDSKFSLLNGDTINIAIAIQAVGIDFTSLQRLYSLPVYLGTVDLTITSVNR